MVYSENGGWGIDRRVPLALIGAILLQTLAAVWWAASVTARLNAMDKVTDLMTPLVQTIPLLSDHQKANEVRIQTLESTIRKLDLIEERQNRVIKVLDENSKKLDTLVGDRK